jgi:hypothetical protein
MDVFARPDSLERLDPGGLFTCFRRADNLFREILWSLESALSK